MDDQQNAMIVFAEELGEVALELLEMQKHVIKAVRFGIDEQRDLPTSNRERIEAEWQDLLGSMLNLEKHGIKLMPNSVAIEKKINKISKYAEYSKSLGTIRQQHEKPTVEVSLRALKSCNVEMTRDWDEDCAQYGHEYKRYYFNEELVKEALATYQTNIND